MTVDHYSPGEVRELVEYMGKELREGRMNEGEFRRGVAKYGFNATDIDQLVKEALQLT